MHNFWHQSPYVRAVIPLILGVAFGLFLPVSQAGLYLIGGCLFGLIPIYILFSRIKNRFKNRFIIGFLLNAGLFLAGSALIFSHELLRISNLEIPPKAQMYEGRITAYPHEGENSVRLDLTVFHTIDQEVKACRPVKIYGYVSPESRLDTLQPGDRIVFRAVLSHKEKVLNPGQFDYAGYLRNKGIATTAFLRDVSVFRPVNQPFSILAFFEKIQQYGVAVFSSFGIPNRELGVASALILGKRSLIDPNLKSDYSEAGAVHILAVSGLHVGIIYLVLVSLLSRLFKARKWRIISFLIIAIFLTFYAGITGFSPSVLRATVMFIFIAAGRIREHRGNIYNILAASAIVLILVNPSVIREVGFQLSYCAVLGLAYFFKPIYGLLIFKSWFADKIWSLLVVAFTAQLATFPLSVYYFGQFPNYFLITNLVVIPAAMVALYSGLTLIAIHWMPLLSNAVAFVLKWTLWCLNTFIEWISDLPFAITDHLHFGLLSVALIYLGMMAAANLIQYPSRRNLYFVLSVMLILTFNWNYKSLTVLNTNRVVVLKGYRGDVICFQSGQSAVIFADDTSGIGRTRNGYHLNGFFDQAGIDRVDWFLFDTNIDTEIPNLIAHDGYFAFNRYKLSLMNKSASAKWADTLSCGFIYVREWINSDTLRIGKSDPLLVVSSGMAPYQRELLLDQLQKNGLDCWDIETQGAYFARPER